MAATSISANEILNKEFGGTQYTPPATWYLALSTTLSSYAGSNVTEPTDPNYARVPWSNDKSHWSTSSSGSLVNSASVVWPISSGSWGVIQEIDLFTAASAGNLRHRVVLASPRTISGSSVFTLIPGALTFSLT